MSSRAFSSRISTVTAFSIWIGFARYYAAKAAARGASKPIIPLRMRGRRVEAGLLVSFIQRKVDKDTLII